VTVEFDPAWEYHEPLQTEVGLFLMEESCHGNPLDAFRCAEHKAIGERFAIVSNPNARWTRQGEYPPVVERAKKTRAAPPPAPPEKPKCRRIPLPRVLLRACAACGGGFVPRRKEQKYCGIRCYTAHGGSYIAGTRKRAVPHPCRGCGTTVVPKNNRVRAFCSRRCAALFNHRKRGAGHADRVCGVHAGV
jgi:hypothetical protein